jgi:hypothetical protein
VSINVFTDQGLSQKVSIALMDSGIDTLEKLCSRSLEDLEDIKGLGPTNLMKIAKIKEAMAFNPPTAAAAEDEEPAEEKYMTKEPPPELATKTTLTIEVELQFRHKEWIERAAEAYGMTEAQVVQQAIRSAYARDPYKAGQTMVSGSILKHDNPHNPNRNN